MYLRLAILLAIMIVPAHADIVFMLGASGTGDNALFQCPADDPICLADLNDNDSTLIGTVQNSIYQVLFSADVGITPAGAGQSTIERATTAANWTSLSFEWINFTGTDELVLRVKPVSDDTTITLFASDQFGGTLTSVPFSVDAPAGSFFTISAVEGQVITALSLTASQSLSAVEQVRLGDIYPETPAVPEPGTTALLGGGLVAVGLLARRRAA